MKTSRKKTIIYSLIKSSVILALLVVLIIGVTLAWFVDSTEPIINSIESNVVSADARIKLYNFVKTEEQDEDSTLITSDMLLQKPTELNQYSLVYDTHATNNDAQNLITIYPSSTQYFMLEYSISIGKSYVLNVYAKGIGYSSVLLAHPNAAKYKESLKQYTYLNVYDDLTETLPYTNANSTSFKMLELAPSFKFVNGRRGEQNVTHKIYFNIEMKGEAEYPEKMDIIKMTQYYFEVF